MVQSSFLLCLFFLYSVSLWSLNIFQMNMHRCSTINFSHSINHKMKMKNEFKRDGLRINVFSKAQLHWLPSTWFTFHYFIVELTLLTMHIYWQAITYCVWSLQRKMNLMKMYTHDSIVITINREIFKLSFDLLNISIKF